MEDVLNRAEEVVLVPVGELIPHPKNMNKHTEDQINRLVKLIEYQGMRNPIIVQKGTSLIVAGHGRLEALKKMGAKKVPVIYQEFEDEAQLYAYMVSDNAINSNQWGGGLDLAQINTEMLDLGPDFDIDMLGIKDFVLEPIEKFEPQSDEDHVPEVQHPITRKGDIWILGNHRLMCGDSTMIDDVEKLLNGNKIDMVFTDPPYNVAFNGRSGKHDVIKNDNLPEEEFEAFIDDVIHVIKIVDPKAYYIWCNWDFYGLLMGKLDYKSCIVWAKNVFGMGRGYRHQHEFCLFNGKIDETIKNESDLWHIKKDSKYVHPTQKPVELSVRAFGNHIKYLNVLDLFGGSGSTLIGAEQTGRKCFVMELDEKYCDVIINRWMNFTGRDDVKLESTGELYNDLKKARA